MRRNDVAMAAFLGLLLAAPVRAEPNSPNSSDAAAKEANRLVRQTLVDEAAGNVVDRRQLLEPTSISDPQSPQLHWQRGFVFEPRADKWLPYEEIPEIAGQDIRLAAYEAKREQHRDTAQAQYQLASWCASNKLFHQARAHLERVIALAPDHTAARQLLGHRRMGDRWVSQEDMVRAQARAHTAQSALRAWRGPIEEIRRDLQSSNRTVRGRARQRFDDIDDPDAVYAIEQVLLRRSGALARLAIDKLRTMLVYQAAEALTWHAVYSPSLDVRNAAARALSDHRKHDYVPLLISAMQTPWRSQVQFDESSDGRLLYRHVLYTEDDDAHKIAVFDSPYRDTNPAFGNINPRIDPLGAVRELTRGRTPQETESLEQAMADHDAVMDQHRRDALARADQRERMVKDRNQQAAEFNTRLCRVLAIASGDSQLRPPDYWRETWRKYNDTYVSPDKPVQRYYRRGRVEGAPPPRRSCECLAPGTIVWTETGQKAIETIRVGDRVLSCDVNSGRLELKPVVGTTIRPKSQLIFIEAGGEFIETTPGHVFWVAGQGWKLARELRRDMTLHTMTGAVLVESVRSASIQQPRNLIVADYHTYFVGKEKILTHDNADRFPTNAIVPGLSADQRNDLEKSTGERESANATSES